MIIIKLNKEERETNAMILHFVKRCIEHGYFLPYSYIKILVELTKETNVKKLCKNVVGKRIVSSDQVVRNYLATLKNFGIISRPRQNKRKINKLFEP